MAGEMAVEEDTVLKVAEQFWEEEVGNRGGGGRGGRDSLTAERGCAVFPRYSRACGFVWVWSCFLRRRLASLGVAPSARAKVTAQGHCILAARPLYPFGHVWAVELRSHLGPRRGPRSERSWNAKRDAARGRGSSGRRRCRLRGEHLSGNVCQGYGLRDVEGLGLLEVRAQAARGRPRRVLLRGEGRGASAASARICRRRPQRKLRAPM